MGQVSLVNVVSISVSQNQIAAQEYNTANVGLFTNDAPNLGTFGSLGYALYLAPTQVGIDFGTSSLTYEMASTLFSQQPNILANNGYLAVIPFLPNTQTLTFSGGTPAMGSFTLVLNGSQSVVITATESASAIQAAIQALPGLSQVQVSGSPISGPISLVFYGVHSQGAVSTTGNTLETSGSASITIVAAVSQSSETLSAAIVRTQGLVSYFGILPAQLMDTMGSAEVLAAATTVQGLNAIMLLSSNNSSDLGSSGLISTLTSASDKQTRSLYYGNTSDGGSSALAFASAYAGKGFSTNFEGSNTTQTMHLKPLSSIVPDPSMTQTILNEAIAAGADTFPSIQGIPSVFTSGVNDFFDNQINLQWLVGAIQVAGFNYLAQSATKSPQTEQGMNGLKGAYRAVLQQAVANGYLAPGSWTSSTTFGIQSDFLTNILTYGYYIYSQPVSQQSAANRAARQAPLVSIAIKLAGAIQSSDVIVYVND